MVDRSKDERYSPIVTRGPYKSSCVNKHQHHMQHPATSQHRKPLSRVCPCISPTTSVSSNDITTMHKKTKMTTCEKAKMMQRIVRPDWFSDSAHTYWVTDIPGQHSRRGGRGQAKGGYSTTGVPLFRVEVHLILLTHLGLAKLLFSQQAKPKGRFCFHLNCHCTPSLPCCPPAPGSRLHQPWNPGRTT